MDGIYDSLPAGSIRLLEFLDDRGLDCKIAAYDLSESPMYIALSYTWSKTNPTNGIGTSTSSQMRLNGKCMNIQENLHDALVHLGNSVFKRGARFWVDAVCINQSDLTERAEQVVMMKTIYEKSHDVYAWLGLPEDIAGLDLARDLLLLWDRHNTHQDAINPNHTVKTKLSSFGPEFPGFPDNETNWRAWQRLTDIMMCDYWTRAWIYQEVMVSRSIRVWYGEYNFEISCLTTASYLARVLQTLPSFEPSFTLYVGSGPSSAVLGARREYWKDENSLARRLLYNLCTIRGAACTNPRDLVYATFTTSEDIRNVLTVDYTRSIADVYTDLARHLLSLSSIGLEMLGLVYTSTPETGTKDRLVDPGDTYMPSWVPDWRVPLAYHSLADTINSWTAYRAGRLYHPFPGTRPYSQIDDRRLTVRGIVSALMQIIKMSSKSEQLQNLEPDTIYNWYLAFVGDDAATTRIQDAFGRTVTVDKRLGSVAGRPTVFRGTAFNSTTLKRLWFEPDGSSPKTGTTWRRIHEKGKKAMRLQRTKPSPPSQTDEVEAQFSLDFILLGCANRRFAQLSDGRFALVPMATSEGDQFAAFAGGPTLYVVRQLSGGDGEFKFVGEAYVDGMMDGAFIEVCKKEGSCLRDICLV